MFPRRRPSRRRSPGRAALATAATVALTAGACGPAADTPPGPDAGSGTLPSSAAPPAGDADSPRRTPRRRPLVIAVHPTVPPPRVSLAVAREVVAGDTTGWPGRTAGTDPPPVRRVTSAAQGRAVLQRTPRTLLVLPVSRLGPWAQAVPVAGVDPVRSPGRYPLRRRGPRPGPVTTVRVVGDVMLGRRVAERAAAVGDPAAPLRPMADYLRGADVTVATLESTLSTAGPPQQGGDSFAAPPAVLRGLQQVGVDALSLANNHVGDFGPRALRATLDAIEQSPVTGVGAGRDVTAAARGAVLDQGGVRVALLGFNAIGETPRATPERAGALSVRMPPRTGPLVPADLSRVTRRVRALDQRADVVVVLPHWGTQYTHQPEPVQTRVARRLARAGADLVVGGHPHWVQGMALHGDTVVAHSLGNYVFDMDFSAQTRQGVGLTATFHGDRLVAARLRPYRIGDDFAPRPLRGARAQEVLGYVWRHSTGPFAR